MSATADTLKLERMLEVMRMVQQDCETEASKIDGEPLDGRFVGTQLGNMLAEISAVARACEVLVEIEVNRA